MNTDICLAESENYRDEYRKGAAGDYADCTCSHCCKLRADYVLPQPKEQKKDPLTGTDFKYVPGDPFW